MPRTTALPEPDVLVLESGQLHLLTAAPVADLVLVEAQAGVDTALSCDNAAQVTNSQ